MSIRPRPVGRFRRAFQDNEWLYFVVGLMGGLLIPQMFQLINTQTAEFLQSLVPEALGIAFTIVILDRLDQRREDRMLKERLLRQIHSRYNPMALAGIEELRMMGFLESGDLRGLSLRGANWLDANLYRADLTESDLTNVKFDKADLVEANLTNAKISEEQMVVTDIMLKATMPDGTRYNGRFNLPSDLSLAKKWGHDLHNPHSMAEYYGVTLEHYLDGQRWAEKHLTALRERARLLQLVK